MSTIIQKPVDPMHAIEPGWKIRDLYEGQFVYLGAPYTHPDPAVREARFRAVTERAARLMLAGLVLFSPITHSHPMRQYGLPVEFEFYRRSARAFIEASAAMVVLKLSGWQESVGLGEERQLAEELGKPILWLEE